LVPIASKYAPTSDDGPWLTHRHPFFDRPAAIRGEATGVGVVSANGGYLVVYSEIEYDLDD
jgi:hypothetical protein